MNPDSYPVYDGSWLVHAIADHYGIPKDLPISEKISRIKKSVYKYTDCGAWIDFDEKGIKVGSIVEGYDAECSFRLSIEDLQDMDGDVSEKALLQMLFNYLDMCEEFVEDFLTEVGNDDTM